MYRSVLGSREYTTLIKTEKIIYRGIRRQEWADPMESPGLECIQRAYGVVHARL